MVVAFVFSWALTLVTMSVILFIALVYGTLIPIIGKQFLQ
jgi:hypothetical protein